MKRRKQSNSDMLKKHRTEYQKNLDTIAQLTARNEELMPIITEEENVRIIALVRSTNMGLEAFQHFLEGHLENDAPFSVNDNSKKENTTNET